MKWLVLSGHPSYLVFGKDRDRFHHFICGTKLFRNQNQLLFVKLKTWHEETKLTERLNKIQTSCDNTILIRVVLGELVPNLVLVWEIISHGSHCSSLTSPSPAREDHRELNSVKSIAPFLSKSAFSAEL